MGSRWRRWVVFAVRWRWIFAHLLPRPLDFIAKAPNFWYGFLVGLAALGLAPSRVGLLNKLFGNGARAWTASELVPVWAILLLGIFFFIAEELLLQQAKLLWDDVRDYERDRRIPWYRDRALAGGFLSLRGAVTNVIVRCVAAFVLAFLLGGAGLVVLFAVIVLHQGIYALWGKPRGAKQPLLLLAILSFSWPLRVLAGMVTVAGNQWLVSSTALVLLVFYFYSFAVMAAQWKMEAEHGRRRGARDLKRLQHGYFLKNGQFWQRYAFVCAIVLTLVLIFSEYTARMCTGAGLVSLWYGSCRGAGGAVNYRSLDYGQLVALGLPAILAVVASGVVAKRLLAPLENAGIWQKVRGHPAQYPISKLHRVGAWFLDAARTPAVVGLALTAVSLAVIGFSDGSTLPLSWAILCLNAVSFVVLEGLTYPEYRYEPLRRSLPVIVKAWGAFLLRSGAGMSLGALIALTGTAFDVEWLESAGQ